MLRPGQPEKPEDEKRAMLSMRVCPNWLKEFRLWSCVQLDSQSKQVEAGIKLLMEKRENDES